MSRLHKIPALAILSIGSNLGGSHNSPAAALAYAVERLQAHNVQLVARSRNFKTRPLGAGLQPAFVNAALLVATSLSAPALLRIAKTIEREAGRRLSRRWGPRILDIDLIDMRGQILPNRRYMPGTGPKLTPLALPHPRAHLRAFVLIPVQDVCPHWRHPRTGTPLSVMIARLRPADRAGVVPIA